MSINLPAACEKCGTIFPSGIVIAGTMINTPFAGNRSGPCPNCGGTGDVIDGTFDFIGNVLRVRSAPLETIEILKRLQEAFSQVNAASTAEEAAQKAEQILPEAAPIIKAAQAGGKAAIAASLFLLLQTCSNMVKVDAKLDLNRLIDQFTAAQSSAPPQQSSLPQPPRRPSMPQHTGPAKNPGQTTNRDGSTPKK